MQPNQPPYGIVPSLPPSAPNQYDFIVNTGPNRNGLFSFNMPSSTATRIALVAGGGMGLIIIAWVFIAILSSAGSTNIDAVLALAQQQTEMARIAQLTDVRTSSQATQNFAATTSLSLLSERQAFINFMAQHGSTPANDALTTTKNTQTDSTLSAAQSSGTYDQTLVNTLQVQLDTYGKALKQAYAGAQNSAERQLLNDAYGQAQLLSTEGAQTH